MIQLTARPALPLGRPAPHPDSREAFLAAWRDDQLPRTRIGPHEGGFTVDGRPMVARPYQLADGRKGWTLVHDEPAAIAHFDQLFAPQVRP